MKNITWSSRVFLTLVLAALGSGLLLRAQNPQQVGTFAPMAFGEQRSHAASATLADGRTLIVGGFDAAGNPTTSILAHNPADGSTAAVGDLPAARVGHTATGLADGRVLIAGGLLGGTATPDLLIFDPADGTTSPVGTMSSVRSGHAAARLQDGTVLIAGGSNDSIALASAEVFDPETGLSTPTIGSMGTGRAGASATLLVDNRVLIAGGNNGATDLATAEIFMPFSQTFEPTDTTLSVERSGHAAVFLPWNSSVLIAGGSSNGVPQTSADLFLPAEFPDPYSYGMGHFVATAPNAMAATRVGAFGGPIGDNGFAFVAGGAPDADRYRFATIKTDKDDYAPGELAVITGSGWQPGETVTLLFQEDPAVHDDYEITTTALPDGTIYHDAWAPEEHDLKVRFYLMAADSRSRAQISFTDNATIVGSLAPRTSSDCTGTGPFQVGNSVTACAGNITWVNENQKDFSISLVSPTNQITCSNQINGTGASPNGTAAHTFSGAAITIGGTWTLIAWQNVNCAGQVRKSATFEVAAATVATTLALSAPSPASVTYGSTGPVTFSATLTRTGDETPVANATIDFQVDTVSVGTAVTTAAGVATLNTYNPAGLAATGHSVQASFAAATISSVAYTGSTSASQTLTVDKANQTISITTNAPANAIYDSTFNVAATADSGLPVAISVSGGVCSIQSGGSGSATIKMTSGTGACTVHYNQVGDGNYNAAPEKTEGVTAQKADQAITVTTNAPPNAIYHTTFNVAATADSTLAVAITASGVCVVDSGGSGSAVIKMTSGTGTCTVQYNQVGDSNFNPAPEKTESVTAQKANQAITITTPAPANAIYNTTFNVAATADSTLAVAITALGVCVVDSGGSGSAVIKMTSGTGTCTVHYNQAGDDNYNATPEKTEGVTAQKADQAVSITTPAPANATYNTTFNVAATADSTLPVAITALGVCVVDNGGSGSAVIKMTSGTGACTVHYNQGGNDNYNAAPEKTEGVTAQKADQAISITTPAPANATYNTTFNVAATADSTLPVAITALGVCVVDSGGSGSAVIKMTSGTGACMVHYNQGGNDNYNAAPEKTDPVTAQKANQAITVTTNAPANAIYNTTFNVVATADSGLPVAITVSGGVCSIQSGGTGSATILMTSGTGTCTVHYNQGGNDNYNAATQKTDSVGALKVLLTITASSHTITFNDPVPSIFAGYSGFVAGDDENDLAQTPTCSTTYTVGSLIGGYPSKCENAASANYSFNYVDGTVTVLTACSAFNGFLSPIGGAVENDNGGSFGDPVRAFKLNSTIPVKFSATCFGAPLTTGIHKLQAIKYSSSVDPDAAIDATPTDAATTGNQFRLTGTEWHFNLSTKGIGISQGTWLLKATLFDGSTYSVWVSIKK